MGKRLQGKFCIVTGGASGLGREIATVFIGEGAKVLITDINTDLGQKTAGKIGAEFAAQDVSNEARWREIVDHVVSSYGGLDILVNNAGIVDTNNGASPEDTPLATWRRMFEINVDSVFLGCRSVIPVMRKNGGGSIINISSIASLVPTPFITAYGASKAAVTHLSTSVALHGAADKIRCNSLHPGQVKTPMHDTLIRDAAETAKAPIDAVRDDFLSRIPLGEFAQTRDLANAALFLASDESRHITGTQMVVDGGMQLTN